MVTEQPAELVAVVADDCILATIAPRAAFNITLESFIPVDGAVVMQPVTDSAGSVLAYAVSLRRFVMRPFTSNTNTP